MGSEQRVNMLQPKMPVYTHVYYTCTTLRDAHELLYYVAADQMIVHFYLQYDLVILGYLIYVPFRCLIQLIYLAVLVTAPI